MQAPNVRRFMPPGLAGLEHVAVKVDVTVNVDVDVIVIGNLPLPDLLPRWPKVKKAVQEDVTRISEEFRRIKAGLQVSFEHTYRYN